MNREIKFRGVHDKENGSIQLVYGDLTHDSKGSTLYWETHPMRIHWHLESGGKANAPIRKGTAMQFTGLYDKNGKEIYEGDVVNLSNYPDGSSHINPGNYKIVWGIFDGGENLAETWILEPSFWAHCLLAQYDSCEVIGNIYENPELTTTEVI